MNITDIRKEYDKGKKHLESLDLKSKTELCYKFYEGDQWAGLKVPKDKEPKVYNFIESVVDVKVAGICVNRASLNYSPNDINEVSQATCDKLNNFIRTKWEELKMDVALWHTATDSLISGSSYVYFYSPTEKQLIENTSIMFADETNRNIQEQKYILLVERKYVDDIKQEARDNGVSEDEINNIRSDKDYTTSTNLDTDDMKATCITRLWKQNGVVHFMKATKDAVFVPETEWGLEYYPICNLLLYPKKWSARGLSKVYPMINTQIGVNKLMANREMAVQIASYPKMVYDTRAIVNPEKLFEVGAAIAVNNMNASDVRKIVDYLSPSPISNDAKVLVDEMINVTKEFANAGKAITGDINPENASGAAIIAVRDMAMLPNSKPVQEFQDFIEQIAIVQLDMWKKYIQHTLRWNIQKDDEVVEYVITKEELNNLNAKVRVDISNENPYSKFAREQALDTLLAQQHITFEEYVELLDNGSNVPKQKLQDLIKRRKSNVSMSDGKINSESGVFEQGGENLSEANVEMQGVQ